MPEKTLNGPAIYMDLKRCIGCNACSLACKQENNVQVGQLWNQVYGGERGDYPSVKAQMLPLTCQHCEEPPCKEKCDSLGYRAILQRSDGIVYIDDARCVGCQKCIPVCPYKAMFFNTEKLKVEKCHFCMHRIDAGLEPACVITCLAMAREYGDLDELKRRHPEAEMMGDDWGQVRTLYEHLGGEPKRRTTGFPGAVECHD